MNKSKHGPRKTNNQKIVAKSNMRGKKIGPDNWLFILTNAISYYIEEGGEIEPFYNEDTGAIGINFCRVGPADQRLHPGFAELFSPPAEEGE
jgi:hypothetical protein